MTKILVEDQDLASQIRSYLLMSGTEVSEDTPIAISLPGSMKVPQRDLSGSGIMTQGGRFAPGYDAKLKSALYAIVRGEPNKVPVELQEHGPMYKPVAEWTVAEAEAALDRFNWGRPQPKPEKKPKPEKPAGEDGEKPKRRRTAAEKKAEAEAGQTAEPEGAVQPEAAEATT